MLLGPNQEILLREIVSLRIAETEQPFAIAVWKKDAKLDGPAGRHRLTATFVSGAAAVDGEAVFQVSDPAAMPDVEADVALWGDVPELEAWLKSRGIRVHPFVPGGATEREVIVTSGNRLVSLPLLQKFSQRIERGATAVMLTPQAALHE